ncbi:MAG: proteasome accessory factor PafA2 family protein, partial [Acidimicrobiales bacterium]
TDGTAMTAVEMQWEYLDRAKKYAEEHGLECIGAPEIGAEVLRLWEQVLTGLETDPTSLARQVDWVAKYRVVDGYRAKHGLRWDDAKLRAMDLQYHDLRPERSLASRVGLERITTDAEVLEAVTEPPTDTRAWFRGKCLQRWASQIVAANWDSMVFDIGGDPLRRVPMMDPTRGTEAHVGRLMAESTTSAELLDRLGQ